MSAVVPVDEPIPFAVELQYPDDRLELDILSQRLVVPKERVANLRWRRTIARMAAEDENYRRQLMSMCADGINGCIFWLNAFAWCHVQKEPDENGHERDLPPNDTCRPFITWPVQDRVIIPGLFDAIDNGHPLVIDKSRQMGVTVLITSVFLWYTLFVPSSNFIVMSITEELVDNSEDPFSIFWKLEYIRQGLPSWMTRGTEKHYMKITKPEHHSGIFGRATASSKGRGGACKAVMFDEAANIRELETLWVAFDHSTPCKIANSTPMGPCFYSELVQDDYTPKLVVPWYNHPIKGRGRRLVMEIDTGEKYVTNAYYEDRVRANGGDRRCTAIAQELDRNHQASGAVFFDLFHIGRHKARARDPDLRGHIRYVGPMDLETALEALSVGRTNLVQPTDIIWLDDDEGPWKLWCPLVEHRGALRPPQDGTAVFGADVGFGLKASESTISVMHVEGPVKLASYANSRINPTAFALEMALAGYFFGGRRRYAYICVEANGPGQECIRTLKRVGYPWIAKREGKGPTGEHQTNKLGWWSDSGGNAKRVLLGSYRYALNTDRFINYELKALKQAERYVQFKDGEISAGPLEVVSPSTRANHGDQVIADALCWYAACRLAPSTAGPELRPPPGSIAYERMKAARTMNPTPWRRDQIWANA